MAANNIENYLQWITPKASDPTYSILKAHLLFEELLRAQLERVLPYPSALDGARLTFVQLLAVVRASTASVPPDCWIWKAIADLNKIRNLLSHETNPKDLKERIASYVKYVEQSTGVPLPEPKRSSGNPSAGTNSHLYGGIDVVTLALYYVVADRFGFDVDIALERDSRRNERLSS